MPPNRKTFLAVCFLNTLLNMLGHLGDSLAMEHVSNYFQFLFSSTTTSPSSQYSIDTVWPWLFFSGLVAVQFLFHQLTKTLLAAPLAHVLFGQLQNNAPRKLYKKRKQNVEKFSCALVEALFYSSYFVMGLRIIIEAPWVWPSHLWWKGQDLEGRLVQPLTMAETTFYVSYAARYLAFFIIVLLEPKRKDFWEMIIHHVTTVVLIYLSFLHGFVRVGFVVMVLLDFADPYLHVAKSFKYIQESRAMAGVGTKISSTCADLWFALFALSFTVTRIGVYGYVTWSCWVEGSENWRSTGTYGLTQDMALGSATWHLMGRGEPAFFCQVLVSVLFVLMCIWEYLLVQAVWKVLSGTELKDFRSDSENENPKVE